jgi:hypothetical protein
MQAVAADKPWKDSPHGPMLERIIPPGYTPAMLPERRSHGAQLVARYCVQCHHLASPKMHDAERWPGVVQRMVPRMEGKGNMGKLMSEMMAGVEAPGAEETQAMVAYLQKHAMRPLDPKRVPEVNTPAAESFRLACSQCHALPDPRMHAPKEWPAVVARMQDYMKLTNRVVGSQPVPGEPQLRVEQINAFLARHARKD